MQNTIIEEFETNEDVVAVLWDEACMHGESLAWFEVFWNNYLLRGSVLIDTTGQFSASYGQPQTLVPYTLGFIIDQDGIVDLPFFGHHPAMVINRIYELLGGAPPATPGGVTAEHIGGNDLLLTWNAVTQDVTGSATVVDYYDVYRATSAQFSIDGISPLGNTTELEYTDLGVTGDSSLNHFYRIVAVVSGLPQSEPSTAVGEFDSSLPVP